jgi:hypothetical protein
VQRRLVLSGLVLFAATFVASCSRPVPSGIAVPKSLVPLVSPDATMLGGIDVEALKSSPLYAKYSSLLNYAGLDQFAAESGVDLRRDLNQLLYVANEKKQYFLVRGNVSAAALEGKLQTEGAKANQYKGIKLWQAPRSALALLKGPVAILGSPDVVRGAIDTEEDGRGEVPELIADHLRSMPKGDQAWFISRRGLPFASAVTRTDIESALSNIVGFIAEAIGSLHVDTGARLQAALYCSTAEGATRVHDALRATVAIGRLSTKDNETSLLKIYDAVQIERDQNIVRLNARLSGEQVDELMGRIKVR